MMCLNSQKQTSKLDDEDLDEAKDNDGFDNLGDALQTSLLSPDIDLVSLAGLVGDQAEEGRLAFPRKYLMTLQQKLLILSLLVLEIPFHAMNRPKVSVKHEYKTCFVALQEAFLAWRPDLLADVKETLGLYGFSKKMLTPGCTMMLPSSATGWIGKYCRQDGCTGV